MPPTETPQPNPQGDVQAPITPPDRPQGDIGNAAAFDLVQQLAHGTSPEPPDKDVSSETKPAPEALPDETKEETDYAVIGNRKFADKEELINYVESQSGYNRFITGNLKKVHPEWFDSDTGKIKPSAITKAQEEHGRVVEALTDEDGESGQNDKELLAEYGIATSEDIKSLRADINAITGKKDASANMEKWLEGNRQAVSHLDEIQEIIAENDKLPVDARYTLDSAWQIVKLNHNITDDTPPDAPTQTKKTLDNQAPLQSSPESSGVMPVQSASSLDVMDAASRSQGF